jgi:hypothetical protein
MITNIDGLSLSEKVSYFLCTVIYTLTFCSIGCVFCGIGCMPLRERNLKSKCFEDFAVYRVKTRSLWCHCLAYCIPLQ